MSDNRRVLIAAVLCFGILGLWWKIFPPPQPTVAPPPAVPSASPPPAPSPSGVPAAPPAGGPMAAAGAGTKAGEAPSPAVPPSPPPAIPSGAARPPESIVDIDTPSVRFALSTWGGTLRHAKLKDGRFLERQNDPTSGRDVVTTSEAGHAALLSTFPDSGFAVPEDAAWKVEKPAPDTVVFWVENDLVRIEKRWKAESARYRLSLEVTVTNKTAKAQDHHLALRVFGHQDPESRGGGFLAGPASNPAELLCQVGEKAFRTPIDSLAKDPIDQMGPIRWMAAGEKFFIVAVAPDPETPPLERKCSGRAAGDGIGEAALAFAGRSVPPGGSASYRVTVFAGPKLTADLEEVRPGGEAAHLDKAVDVSVAIIARPMLSLLQLFHRGTGNWGIAIILLTLFVRTLTFPVMQKQMLSGKRMARLAPKLQIIRDKYKNDRQRQGAETMNLYKAHGISPFAGCLPALLQMPIWIALYSTLQYSVELYRSPFLLWIKDLTASDPTYVLPLAMGAIMFIQMRMSPAGTDPQQQKMMAVMMPVMFTAISLRLPAGLSLYMLTSYLVGILQQLWVNHLDKKLHGPMPPQPKPA